jgi:hypothetical protein
LHLNNRIAKATMKLSFTDGNLTASPESIEDVRALLAFEAKSAPVEPEPTVKSTVKRGRPAKSENALQAALRDRAVRERKAAYMREYWRKQKQNKRG